jgi:inosine-uridine nucleoside N-ribohydrolase
VIVDLGVGYTPDSALALALIACGLPVSLVVTSDEFDGGQRARLARYLLDTMGRTRIPVVAGAELPGAARRWVCDGVVPESTARPDGSLVDAVRWVLRGNAPVHWLGLGPMSNLATVLDALPGAVDKLHVTQTGGPGGPDVNLALDPAAAQAVLTAGVDITLVKPEPVQREHLVVDSLSTLCQQLARTNGPRWARTVRWCFDEWFSEQYPHAMLYAPFTVAFAAGLRFVSASRMVPVDVNDKGRLRIDEDAQGRARIADVGRCERFPRWLGDRVDIAYVTQLGGGIEPDLLHRAAV